MLDNQKSRKGTKMNTKQLLTQIDRLSTISAIKNNPRNRKDLEIIRERLADDTFRIAVVGEFSSGKSTFINALIGSDLLTHAVNETTATITNIHNVKKDDRRVGTCEIEYRDGKKISINDMAKLYEYTTAQSAKEVADTIMRVSVYVNFMDAAYPIEIIDTPGLNGIADKHREITIEEVKRAHACIYLLSIKGLTSSDTEFIKVLKKYQSRFIFIQNFIDQLNASEGETVDNKLLSVKRLIEETLNDEGIYFDYDVCAVSALKRLCSKDHTIRKLYSDDIRELTENDRRQLAEESHFADFESILSGLASNERYKELVIISAVPALKTLIDQTLPNMIRRQELNAELQKQDDKTKRIEKSQKIMDQIEKGKEERRKKLSNFIISRDKENRQGLKEYSDHRLREVYQIVCEEIDKRIQNYNDLEELELVEKKPVPEFYGIWTANLINRELIPDIDERISENLTHLYDEAAQRIMGYVSNFSGNTEELNIRIQGTEEKYNIDNVDCLMQISEYKRELDDKINRKEKARKEADESRRQLENVNSELNRVRNQKNVDKQEGQREIASLGNKPEIEKKTEKKTRYVKRGGLGIMDFFLGDKKEVYYETVYDDSKLREWTQKRNEYLNRQQQKLEQHNNKIAALNTRKITFENSVKERDRLNSKLQNDIQDLEGLIARETEIYENFLKNYKREYCETQKKKIKASLEKCLFDRTGDECTIERLEQHIDQVSNTYIKPISDKIDRYYIDSVEEQIEALKNMIENNSQQLETQYQADANAIAELTKIKDMLKEI